MGIFQPLQRLERKPTESAILRQNCVNWLKRKREGAIKKRRVAIDGGEIVSDEYIGRFKTENSLQELPQDGWSISNNELLLLEYGVKNYQGVAEERDAKVRRERKAASVNAAPVEIVRILRKETEHLPQYPFQIMI